MIESKIGIVTPEQADHCKVFVKGLDYLEQVKRGNIQRDSYTTRVVEGYLWGIARELQFDGKGGIITDILRMRTKK